MGGLREIRRLGDIARHHARERPGGIILIYRDRRTTFAEFDRHTSRIANGLLAAGLSRGDRVAFLGRNSDQYFELLIGCAKAGCVIVPINWRLAEEEIAYIVDDAQATALFAGIEFATIAERLAERFHPHLVVGMEDAELSHGTFQTWRDRQSDADPQRDTAPDDTAVQIYTSGTTGRPKGVMIRHSGILLRRLTQSLDGPEWGRWSSDDVSLAAMPVFHIGGTGWGIAGLLSGATTVVVPEFDPQTVLDFIERYRISKLFMVPSAMQIVLRQARVRPVDFSRVRNITYGASPIPLPLLRECMEVFGCGFVQNYGLTESTGTIVSLPPEDHVPEGSDRMRSTGLPLPGVEIAILREDGTLADAGENGEIITKSAGNMAGYWRKPDATAAAFTADGWLRTGDIGYRDVDGYLYITDRINDLIISGGENIYPREVENVLAEHPGIAEVAVIGVPDAKWGETVKAIIVRHPNAVADAAEILSWARGRIAAFKAPKSIDFIAEMPRNASGKVLRRVLREPYWRDHERGVN